MNRKRQRVRTITVIVATSAIAFALYPASPALWAKKGGKKKQQQQQPTPEPTPTPAPTPDTAPASSKGAVPAALTPLEAAERAVSDAQDALDAFVAAQKAAYEKTDQLAAAKDAVAKDTAALNALEAPLRQKLQESDADYSLALDEIVEARQRLDDAVKAKDDKEIGTARAGVRYFQGTITKAEAGILADPAVKKAQAQLDADTAKLVGLQSDFQKSLEASADYRALASALDNARADLAKLQTAAAQ